MNLLYVSIFIFFLFLVSLTFYMRYSINASKEKMQDAFKSISFDILEKNTQMFTELSKQSFDKYHLGFQTDLSVKQKELETILSPLKESLEKVDQYTKEIESKRQNAYGSLKTQLDSLIEAENILRKETQTLTSALHSPNLKGAWGQIHLKRVVELAGLMENCDFYEQQSIVSEDKTYRPDLIIRLPGEKEIVIDAKTPIEAFLDADDENRQNKTNNSAQILKKHINELSSKEYFSKLENSAEYVILFLPAEAFLLKALKIDSAIIEMAASKNILIATPTTLIAILKTIAYVWKQEKINSNSKEIAQIGSQLYERLSVMNSYFTKLGKNLSSSVEAYNQTISSLNSRVMVSAKKLKDIGLSSKESFLNEISKSCSDISLENINEI